MGAKTTFRCLGWGEGDGRKDQRERDRREKAAGQGAAALESPERRREKATVEGAAALGAEQGMQIVADKAQANRGCGVRMWTCEAPPMAQKQYSCVQRGCTGPYLSSVVSAQ